MHGQPLAHRKTLIDILNQCESDLRAQSDPSAQRQRILTLLNAYSEEQLLDLFELSSQPDYCDTHKQLSLLWSYRHKQEVPIPTHPYQQAVDTILTVSQAIINNWPGLTPKKVSRLGGLIKGAAQVAKASYEV